MFGRRQAPDINPGDMVSTADGRGVVVDSKQNRDGYYTRFLVDILDWEDDNLKWYSIEELIVDD